MEKAYCGLGLVSCNFLVAEADDMFLCRPLRRNTDGAAVSLVPAQHIRLIGGRHVAHRAAPLEAADLSASLTVEGQQVADGTTAVDGEGTSIMGIPKWEWLKLQVAWIC